MRKLRRGWADRRAHRGPRSARLLALAAGLALLFCEAARAEGLLRLEDCKIVDDRGPVRAIGVNYVDGFWRFAADGDREAYLPDIDALAKAKIPFIRMAFGPWAAYRADAPPAAAIADFVAHRDRYFERLKTFLADLKAHNIGAVLDVFWGVEPYAPAFGETIEAPYRAGTRTAAFLDETVAELARRHGRDPAIWAIEFVNEGNLSIDFPRAPHNRAEFTALLARLGAILHEAGDRHLVDSGDALPRPAAERLHDHDGWAPDTRENFLAALAAENPVPVASVHVYPENPGARPWDGGDPLGVLAVLVEHARRACQPVFVGEFGATDPARADAYIAGVAASGVPLAALWGFGRPAFDPMAFGIDEAGRARLARLRPP